MVKIIFDIETTGLNPALDRIIVIGYKVDEQPIKIIEGNEKDILQNFFKIVRSQKSVYLIGFVISFDINFIRIRAILNNIKPINFNTIQNIDLRKVLIGDSRLHGKLGDYGKALGIEKHNGINGELVPILFQEGKIDLIKKYCETDVKITSMLYNRLKELDLV